MAQSLEVLLIELLMPDNDARRQAEDHIKRLAKDPQAIPALIHHLRTAKTPNPQEDHRPLGQALPTPPPTSKASPWNTVEPGHEHYACVVDLLVRAGRLLEAKELIYQMPMQAGPSIWGALLAGYRKHQNLDVAEIAAGKLFVLEPENSGNYVLLSNMYAEAGMWEDVNNLCALLKCQGKKKNPGSSWIEINGKSHLFLGGDKSHPQSKEIRLLLEALPEKIKAAGYIPDTSFALHGVGEDEKE